MYNKSRGVNKDSVGGWGVNFVMWRNFFSPPRIFFPPPLCISNYWFYLGFPSFLAFTNSIRFHLVLHPLFFFGKELKLVEAISEVIPAIQGLNISGVITYKILGGVITPRILGGVNNPDTPPYLRHSIIPLLKSTVFLCYSIFIH